MTKKKEKIVEVETPQVEATVIEKPVVNTPKIEVKPKKKGPENEWEIKNRTYFLRGKERTSLSRSIKCSDIFYFDEEKGYQRELKYCQNQRTPFVDEMKGDQRLEHVVFRKGTLHVPRENQTLQKLLSLYHPHRDKLFYEYKPVTKATNEIENIELEIEALNAARNVEISLVEAIMRAEVGSRVSDMSSKELRRDALLFAKRNPRLFLALILDENIELRNVGIKATEQGILKLSSDQRTFSWGSNDRKLMTVPFDEHPYSALAAWFKTDEGMEIYSNIEKRMN